MKEQKLTVDEISHIFGMYGIGAPVLTVDGDGHLMTIHAKAITVSLKIISSHQELHGFDKGNGGLHRSYLHKDSFCQLTLTPLSKLTDEHALEFAKIEMHHSAWTSDVGRKRLALELQEAVMRDGYKYGPISYRTFQYLISKGYAVPLWFGIDHWANNKTAIELGIAIETTTP